MVDSSAVDFDLVMPLNERRWYITCVKFYICIQLILPFTHIKDQVGDKHKYVYICSASVCQVLDVCNDIGQQH